MASAHRYSSSARLLQFCAFFSLNELYPGVGECPIACLPVTIMKADEALEVLRGLVAGAIRAPEEEPPRGAGPAELDSPQARLSCGIPPVLRAWLSVPGSEDRTWRCLRAAARRAIAGHGLAAGSVPGMGGTGLAPRGW